MVGLPIAIVDVATIVIAHHWAGNHLIRAAVDPIKPNFSIHWPAGSVELIIVRY